MSTLAAAGHHLTSSAQLDNVLQLQGPITQLEPLIALLPCLLHVYSPACIHSRMLLSGPACRKLHSQTSSLRGARLLHTAPAWAYCSETAS